MTEPEPVERYRALSEAFSNNKNKVAISYALLLAVLDTTPLPGEVQEIPRFPLNTTRGIRGRYTFGRTYPVGLTDGAAFVTINVPGQGLRTTTRM